MFLRCHRYFEVGWEQYDYNDEEEEDTIYCWVV